MNLTLAEADVKDLCRKAGVAISAIEPLPSGGTRLICITAPGAEEMRLRLRGHLIDGAVTRHRFYRAPGSQGGY